MPEDWQEKLAKLRQKDRDARWTVKTTKDRPARGGTRLVDLAIPAFGYQNRVGADRRHRLIRTWLVTDAAAHARRVPGQSARSHEHGRRRLGRHGLSLKENEKLLRQRMTGEPHPPEEPERHPMPVRTAKANATKSAIRAHVEHVFADQKH